MEDAANKPSTDSSSEDAAPNQSLAQMVYSENRRKAEESHAVLDRVSSKNDLPLYNQPSDTDLYSFNKKSYTVFKKKLVEYFKAAQAEREQKDRVETETKVNFKDQADIEEVEEEGYDNTHYTALSRATTAIVSTGCVIIIQWYKLS